MMLWEYKGLRGIRQARKHMAWYAKDFKGAAELRDRLFQVETVEAGMQLLDEAIAQLQSSPEPADH